MLEVVALEHGHHGLHFLVQGAASDDHQFRHRRKGRMLSAPVLGHLLVESLNSSDDIVRSSVAWSGNVDFSDLLAVAPDDDQQLPVSTCEKASTCIVVCKNGS